MVPDFSEKLREYVSEFNSRDEEIYVNDICNADSFDYLKNNAPLLDCPDKELEKTFYFRLWTLRKHWKSTPVGHVMTEFLPDVCWAGPYNTINCPLGHHIREARWLRDGEGRLREYIRFWLDGHGDALSYSMWFASAVEAFFSLHPDDELMKEFVPKLDELYKKREATSLLPCGLFWSNDDRDGMEFSISGPGIRPTLNSYMCADAFAISRMAAGSGMYELSEEYYEKGSAVLHGMNKLLWDGDFYRTIPCSADMSDTLEHRPEVAADNRARELVGYIPWYFNLADERKDDAFLQLLDEEGFSAPYGLTTAERRHPRFLYEVDHDCLWNGYVWPFATSQTLTALANMIHDRKERSVLSKEDYYKLLKQYALSHRLVRDDGSEQCWIDESMEPFTGRWYTRDEIIRKRNGIFEGMRERGKDYNHSTFCDLVLSGLLGIHAEDGALKAEPIIPDDWDYFAVTGLTQDNYCVIYDKDGSRYGCGAGLHCFKA